MADPFDPFEPAEHSRPSRARLSNELEPRPRSLATKLAEVMGEVGWIPKHGHNDHHNYDFVRESDVVDAIRDKLAARNIAISTTVVSFKTEPHPSAGMYAEVHMRYTLIDGDTRERIETDGLGAGTDKPGDKALYKAQTGAKKYALTQAFLLATGEDPENESAPKPERRRSTAGPAAGESEQGRSSAKGKATQAPSTPPRSPSSTGPATDAEKKSLRDLSSEFGWTEEQVLAYCSGNPIDELLSAKAQELLSVWTRYANGFRRARSRKEPVPILAVPGAGKQVAPGSSPPPLVAALHAVVADKTAKKACSNVSETGQRCVAPMPHVMGPGCSFVVAKTS